MPADFRQHENRFVDKFKFHAWSMTGLKLSHRPEMHIRHVRRLLGLSSPSFCEPVLNCSPSWSTALLTIATDPTATPLATPKVNNMPLASQPPKRLQPPIFAAAGK